MLFLWGNESVAHEREIRDLGSIQEKERTRFTCCQSDVGFQVDHSRKLLLHLSFMICTLLAIYSWLSPVMSANKERTFIMIKPDGVQRNIVGEVIKRFEQKGFKLVALKFQQVGFH